MEIKQSTPKAHSGHKWIDPSCCPIFFSHDNNDTLPHIKFYKSLYKTALESSFTLF